MILISGTFGALGGQPRWLATVAGFLPAQPMIDAAPHALQHPAGAPVVAGHDLVVLAGWVAAGAIASLLLFRWEPSRPPRRRAANAADGRQPANAEPDHGVAASR